MAQAVGTLPKANIHHVLYEITAIFKRRLFLFARQLGAIRDTCETAETAKTLAPSDRSLQRRVICIDLGA